MNRRTASKLIVAGTTGLIAQACSGQTTSLTAPSNTPTSNAPKITLLVYLQQRGITATAVSVGTNGAREIAINGSVSDNFRVNGDIVGIDPRIRDDEKFTPTLDFAAFLVPSDATVSYNT